ncbi:Myosin-binding protein C, slow-type, partial [Perkinsus chesapeaki]
MGPKDFRWQYPEDDGGSPVRSFEVLMRPFNATGNYPVNWTSLNDSVFYYHPWQRSFSRTDLFGVGHVFSMSVRAVTDAGKGLASSDVSVTGGQRHRYVQLKGMSVSENFIRLEWDSPAPAIPMDVYVDDGNGGPLQLWLDNLHATNVAVGPLTTGKSYRVQVMSSTSCIAEQCLGTPTTSNGQPSVISNIISIILSGHAQPPTALVHVRHTGTSVEVSWVPHINTGGTPVTSWIVERDIGTSNVHRYPDTEFTGIGLVDSATSKTLYVDAPPLQQSSILGWCWLCPIRYRYRVRPVNAAGMSRWPSAAIEAWMVPTPSRPTVSLEYLNEGPCLILSWNRVPYADYYQIRGGPSDPAFETSDEVLVNETSALQRHFCPDDGAYGKRHSFSVRPLNLAGNPGPWSLYATAFMARPPSPPTSLQMIDSDCYRGPNITFRCMTADFGIIDNHTIVNSTACNKLSWEAPNDEGGCPIVEYHIFRDGDRIGGVTGSVTAFADFNDTLVCGRKYKYAIRAVNCRRDQCSPPATTEALQGARPLPLCSKFIETANGWICDENGLTGKPYSNKSIYYTWPRLGSSSTLRADWQAGFVGNWSVLGYILLVDDGRLGDMKVMFNGVNSPAQTYYIHQNLTPGMTYRAAVRAVTTVGEGELSPILYTTMAEPPDPPTNLIIKWATPTGGVDLYWTPPVYTGHSPITHYIIQHHVADENSDFFTVPRLPSGVEEGPYRLDEDDDLAGDREFEFRMASVNVVGRSRWSSISSKWLGELPVALPDRLSPWISMLNKTHIEVSWPQLDDESLLRMPNIFGPRKDAWGYVLYRYSYSGNFTPTEVFRVSAASGITSGLVAVPKDTQCGGLVCITSRLWTLVGDGPAYPEQKVCSETADIPGMPTNPTVVPWSRNDSNVLISWQDPSYTGCHIVVQYLVEMYDTTATDDEAIWHSAGLAPANVSTLQQPEYYEMAMNITNLVPAKEYWFRVRARTYFNYVCSARDTCTSSSLSRIDGCKTAKYGSYCKAWKEPAVCFGLVRKADGSYCFQPNDKDCFGDAVSCDTSVTTTVAPVTSTT